MRIDRNMLPASGSIERVKIISGRLGLALSFLFLLVAGIAAPVATRPTKTYKRGHVVEFDGWTVVVLRVQPRWVSASARPSAGARFVALELQVTNKAQRVRNSPIPGLCTLVRSPGAEHLGLLVVGGPSPKFDRSNVPPNQPRRGWATFEAADVKGLLLQCEPGAAPDISMDPDTKRIWDLGL